MVKKFILLLILSLLLTACCITRPDTPVPTGHPTGEIDQPQVMYDDQIYYYWATGFDDELPASYIYVGSVSYINNKLQPAENFAGCRLEEGQRVYANPDYVSVIYIEYNDGYAKFSLSQNSENKAETDSTSG